MHVTQHGSCGDVDLQQPASSSTVASERASHALLVVQALDMATANPLPTNAMPLGGNPATMAAIHRSTRMAWEQAESMPVRPPSSPAVHLVGGNLLARPGSWPCMQQVGACRTCREAQAGIVCGYMTPPSGCLLQRAGAGSPGTQSAPHKATHINVAQTRKCHPALASVSSRCC